ncbi:hypothetical protein PCL_07689 [Purpureocillium lilacinum]|uniref:Uncharacterized protein n=1 Tax=Purpureocillium lilacinum TaxID=33203 RepID=A0A2U3EIM2_PURLI|nr:hypothetical protein PCL_07689 [Purpureocillium lilacinum]
MMKAPMAKGKIWRDRQMSRMAIAQRRPREATDGLPSGPRNRRMGAWPGWHGELGTCHGDATPWLGKCVTRSGWRPNPHNKEVVTGHGGVSHHDAASTDVDNQVASRSDTPGTTRYIAPGAAARAQLCAPPQASQRGMKGQKEARGLLQGRARGTRGIMPLPVVWQVAATGIVETVAVVSWVPDGAAEAETSNSSLARVSAERRHRGGGGGGGANSGLMQKVISHLPDPFFRTGGGSRRAAWRSVSRPMTAAPGPTPKPTDTQPGPGDGIWGEGGGGGVLAVWADLDGRRGLLAAGEVVVVTGGGGGFSVVLRWARRPAEEQGSLPDEPAVAREAQDDGMMERGRAGEGGRAAQSGCAGSTAAALVPAGHPRQQQHRQQQQQQQQQHLEHDDDNEDDAHGGASATTFGTGKRQSNIPHTGPGRRRGTRADGCRQAGAPFCSPRPRPLSRARAPLGWLAGWLPFHSDEATPPPWLVLTVRRPGPLPLPLPQTRPRPPRVVPIRLGVGRFGVCPATKRHDAALLACRRPTLVVNVLGGQAGRKLHPPPPPGPPCRVHVAAAAGHGPRPALTRAGLWTKMGAGSVGGAAS